MFQQGFGRSSAQNHGPGGDVRLNSGEPLLLFLLLQEYRKKWRLGLNRQITTIENIYIATREMPTCRGAGSALFPVCYVDVHAAIMESTCTELVRGAWVTGGV